MDVWQYMMSNGTNFWGTSSDPGGYNDKYNHYIAFPNKAPAYRSSGKLASTDPLIIMNEEFFNKFLSGNFEKDLKKAINYARGKALS